MSTVDRLEQVCFLLGLELGGADGAPPAVAAYDTYFATHVQPFIDACADLKFAERKKDKEFNKMAEQCKLAWTEQRNFLFATTACAKPDQPTLMTFMDPIAKVIQKAGMSWPRKTKVIDHLKAFNEAIQALNWLAMDGGGPYILSQKDSVEFSTNKILRAARDLPDQEQAAAHKKWVLALKTMVVELAEYCNTFHKQGIVWKFGGEVCTEWKAPEADAKAAAKSDEDRLGDAVTALEAYAAKLAGGSGDGPPPAIQAWKDLLDGELKAFVDAANHAELGLDAKTIPAWATEGWTHTGRVIEAATVAKKPSDEDFGALLGPISGAIGASMDPPRRDDNFDFIKGFNEVLQTLAWVTMPGGVDYIQSQIDASALYTNKILRVARDAPDAKKEAMRAYVKTLKELGTATKEYVKEWHKTGIVWRGQDGLPTEYTHFPQA